MVLASRRSLALAIALTVPVMASTVVAVIALSGDEESSEPLALTSEGPTFTSLDGLVAACDLVVIAAVADVGDGRVLTAPDRPDSGIRTRLVELTIVRTLAGDAVDPLIVEEPAELLDNTPVVVDGMSPLAEGDRAIWFLVAGGTDELPYYAAVNAQGRYVITGDTLQAAGTDPLTRQLVALGPDGLVAAVLDH